VTEGEDKPLKYPGLFHTADVAAITKTDLAEACGFDRAALVAHFAQVRPGMPVFDTSVRTGEGIECWLDYLARRRRAITA